MKRGKEEEEEKISVEPMFPRLNVKDDKGGGPRAPPRNKMALYEHLSIPSHTFTTHHNASFPRHTNSFFPPPPPPGPSNQPCGVERNLTSQHLDSSASGHVTQLSLTENVSTLPHRRDQRKKTLREDHDFAVPVYTTNSQCPGRAKIEKCTTLFRDQAKGVGGFANSLGSSATHGMDLEKSALGCERVNDSLRQESTSTRMIDQDGGESRVMETDDGVEESHGKCRRYVSVEHINEEACDDDDDLMVDSSSISSLDVFSPDEVVGVLGQKRFWRARKAIANQQRIFAVQLFELHRLIKVQKLIASSSDVLLDEISYLGKVAAQSYPVKKLLPSESTVKPPPLPHATKHRSSDSEKTDQQHRMECTAENVVGKSSNQGQHQPPSNYPPPAVNGCYYPPPLPGGNQQWLIPVMSPSEGLIYKPHPGPGGHHTEALVCGGYYGHFMPAPMMMGSFMGGGNGYFPPYGMMNPYGSGQQQQQQPPNEQMNQFVHPGNLQYASSAVNTQQQSSVNEEVSQQQPTKSYPLARKSRQRSIGSSSPSGPEGISGRNSFRPFSVVDDDDNNEQMMTTTTTTTRTTVTQTTRDGGGGVTKVIKVVPHNAKLASENAARIFRSIQEERKHYDSFSNLP